LNVSKTIIIPFSIRTVIYNLSDANVRLCVLFLQGCVPIVSIGPVKHRICFILALSQKAIYIFDWTFHLCYRGLCSI